ncbi:MAG: dTDP-4-dehydrorhamnose reductase [Clostridium sp.]
MKILITGNKGQLGTQITNIIKNGKSEIGDIPECIKSAEIIGVDIDVLDITDLKAVKQYINALKPDVVINSAAYTNVDACEENKDLAFKVNTVGPRNLAIASEEVGAKLIQVSTDYVFSGEGTVPLTECDITGPVSVYGTTKLMGEDYVRNFSSKYFIVRTAWLYGYIGKNFVYTIMKAAKERGHLTVVDDQRGNPTNAEDLAYHILNLIPTEEYGIYNCTGRGECTWYDFACKIVEFAGIECKVEPVTSDDFKRAAKRPSFSSLDNMMLRCTIGDSTRPWEEALKVFIDNVKQ